MIRFLGLLITTERQLQKEIEAMVDLGTDVGRVPGRCEIAEHYGLDITDLPDEMFELRGSLRLYPHPVGCPDIAPTTKRCG